MNAANLSLAQAPREISIIPLRVFAARSATFDFIHAGIPENHKRQIVNALFGAVPLAEHGWSISDTRIRPIRRYWGRTVWRATRGAAA